MRKHRGEPVGDVNLLKADLVTMTGANAFAVGNAIGGSNVYYAQNTTPATYTSAAVSS